MSTAPQRQQRRITPISIDQLAARMLPLLQPPEGDAAKLRKAERVFEMLEEMKITSTADLTPTPEMLCGYLQTWGASTKRATIRETLNNLAHVLDFAVAWDHLEPTSLARSRPLQIPPSWDEDDERFGGIAQARPPKRVYLFPAPDWNLFLRVVALMKARSHRWEYARDYSLWATVTLAQVKLSEALTVRIDDTDLAGRTLRVPQRLLSRKCKYPSVILLSNMHRDIMRRWIPRVHCPHVFPLLTRLGPWDRHSVGNRLREAAGEALGDEQAASAFTPGGMLEFGRLHSDRLTDPESSPFRINPDDRSTLNLTPEPIGQLEEFLVEHFGGPGSMSSSAIGVRRVFGNFRQMVPPVLLTTDIGRPDFIGGYRAVAGIHEQAEGPELFKLAIVRAVCRHAIDQGYLDLDPFIGQPDVRSRKPAPLKSRDRRKHRRRVAPVELLPPPLALPDPASAPRICPLELREGFPPLVYGKEIPPLTGIAFELARFAVQRFHQNGFCLAKEFRDHTSSQSSRPIKSLTDKLNDKKYELLARVLIWERKKGGTLRIIDPGPKT